MYQSDMVNKLLTKATSLENKLLFSSVCSAVAQALSDSGVKAVYNYPGRPATYLVDELKKNQPHIEVQDYLPNEYVATAKGFGSSVAGCERTLVLFKDAGTNVACDLFYCMNHVGINRGLVFFIVDDPSAWHSQNEEDTRGIYFNAGLPIFEPVDQYSSYYSTILAYELSETFRLPFFIRSTNRAVSEIFDLNKNDYKATKIPFVTDFVDIPFDAKDKWKSIFISVEEDREELAEKQKDISELFDSLNINKVIGDGKLGIIASGFVATQLEREGLTEDVSLLKLITVYPLPEKTILDFIKDKERVLIIEQGEPLLELLVRDLAQRNGYSNPILGRNNNFVRKVGEFRDDDLKISVTAFKENKKPKTFPKHKELAQAPPFDKNDNYLIFLDCLRDAVKETGCRPLFCADAGQTSKIPETPGYEDLLHMETTMGCVVSYLSGGIESYKRAGKQVPFKGIAYVGDSDFFHSALSGICEASAKDHPILLLIIDNQGAVSTGKQPHLGMKINNDIKELSTKEFLKAMKVSFLEEASTENKTDLKNKLLEGIKCDKFYALIVHL